MTEGVKTIRETILSNDLPVVPAAERERPSLPQSELEREAFIETQQKELGRLLDKIRDSRTVNYYAAISLLSDMELPLENIQRVSGEGRLFGDTIENYVLPAAAEVMKHFGTCIRMPSSEGIGYSDEHEITCSTNDFRRMSKPCDTALVLGSFQREGKHLERQAKADTSIKDPYSLNADEYISQMRGIIKQAELEAEAGNYTRSLKALKDFGALTHRQTCIELGHDPADRAVLYSGLSTSAGRAA